jgi:hypothetical protein
MKKVLLFSRLLPIWAVWLALSARAEFTATYTFADFQQNPLTTRALQITPLFTITESGTNFITGDRRRYTNSVTGYVPVSGMVPGGYRIEFFGPYTTTTFTNVFGTNVTGTVNAKDYVSASLAVNSFTTAFSQAQSTARFHDVAGDTSTNAQFRGTLIFAIGATNLNYVWTRTNVNGAGTWLPAAGGGGGAWGEITGTLADQTDLQDELNAKAPLESPTFTGTINGDAQSLSDSVLSENVAQKNQPNYAGAAGGWGNENEFDAEVYMTELYLGRNRAGVRDPSTIAFFMQMLDEAERDNANTHDGGFIYNTDLGALQFNYDETWRSLLFEDGSGANLSGVYKPGGDLVAIEDGGTGASTASAARTALGLAIGTDVAAQSSLASYLPLAGGTMTGNLLFSTDNTRDIGASGATRPRNGYFGTLVATPSLQVGSTAVPANTLAYVRGTGSSTATWKGRIIAGGDSVAFLMGEFNSRAWLGGHNAALNAWAPLYLNPDGTSDLHLGDSANNGNNAATIVRISNSGGRVTFNSSAVIDGSGVYFGKGYGLTNTVTTSATGITLSSSHWNGLVVITADSQTVTLPTAVGIVGMEFTVKYTAGAGSLTIATTSSQTIDGTTPVALTTMQARTYRSNNANWLIVSGYN